MMTLILLAAAAAAAPASSADRCKPQQGATRLLPGQAARAAKAPAKERPVAVRRSTIGCIDPKTIDFTK